MLSGMTAKPSIDISSYTGKVTIVPARKTRKHSSRTKSHMVGFGYAAGGNKLRTSKVAA
jgi:hypothetical protein